MVPRRLPCGVRAARPFAPAPRPAPAPSVAAPADAQGTFAAPAIYDFDESLRFLPLGRYDPTCRRGTGVLAKAGRTPAGPVTLELRRTTECLVARAFGAGAAWAVERAPALLGLQDDPASFRPPPGRLGILARRGRGLHLTRSPFVFDALAGVILQQRVAWRDATRAWRQLTERFGEPAPGPTGLTLPLSPSQWAALSGEDLRRAGIDGQRARALRAAAREARTIDLTFDQSLEEARARLAGVPGCGPWTVAMTLGYALGDPDAVIEGDLHLPRLVAWALAGEHEATDARMIELLLPHRGHRFRLVRLLYAAGLGTSITSRSRAARS
jgi:3-methyladenine DNA glycosylase/8-oxoguanine DNA glycosylase